MFLREAPTISKKLINTVIVFLAKSACIFSIASKAL